MDLKFITDWLNCGTTTYDEIVTQTVMVLLETYFLNVLLCHDISVPIRIIQHFEYRLGTKTWFALTAIRTNQQRSDRLEINHTVSSFDRYKKQNRFVLTVVRTIQQRTGRLKNKSYCERLWPGQKTKSIRTNRHSYYPTTNRPIKNKSYSERLWPGQKTK